MTAFGGSNPFPRKFGGGLSYHRQEEIALRSAFQRDGFDPDEPTKAAEAYALSRALGGVWALNERLRGAEVADRMLETLPVNEEFLGITPESVESLNERRNTVKAKLQALAGQATSEHVELVLTTLLGPSFEGLARVETNEDWAYWPVQNPGPPAREWMSAFGILGIKIRRGAQSNGRWARDLQRTYDLMQTLLPAWQYYVIGTYDEGFVCGDGAGTGTVDETFIGDA